MKQRPTSVPTLPGSRTTTPSNSAGKRTLKDTPIPISSTPTVISLQRERNRPSLLEHDQPVGRRHHRTSLCQFPAGSAVDNYNVDSPAVAKLGKHQLGFYAQDSWKVTRKLTLELGLRYDFSTAGKEQYGRYGFLRPHRGQYARRWTSRGRHLWGDLRLRQ